MEGRRKTGRCLAYGGTYLSQMNLHFDREHDVKPNKEAVLVAFEHQEASGGDMGGRETFLALFKIIFTESFQSHLIFWSVLKPRRETYSLCLWEQRLTFQWAIGNKKKKKICPN